MLVLLWPFLTAKDHINSCSIQGLTHPLPSCTSKDGEGCTGVVLVGPGLSCSFPLQQSDLAGPRSWEYPLGQDATPMQHSETRAVIHRGNHFPWDRGNGSHFLLFTYPIFKVPILTTSIIQLAQQQLGCCSL